MAAIYAITNLITRRTYVGRSAAAPPHRVKQHFKDLRRKAHIVELMQEDFDKYGEESFAYHYLDAFDDAEAKRMEVFMMKVLRSQDPRYGYNYKDRAGTSQRAINERWRTPAHSWSFPIRKERKRHRLLEE